MTVQIYQWIVISLLALLSFFLRRVLNTLDDLVKQVSKQNGRIGKLEEWKSNFMEEVRERFFRLEER